MKKNSLVIALLAAGQTLAAAPLPDYPVVYSPEVGGPVPNPAYAAARSQARSAAPAAAQSQAPEQPLRYALEINAGYAFKAVPDSRFACDMTTAELEGAYFIMPHHAVTLSLGYAGGGSTRDYWVWNGKGYTPFTDSFDRSSFTVMAGYRYSRMLGRYVLLQTGVKAGLDVQTLDVDYGPGWHPYPYARYDGQDDTVAGLAYAGYASVGFFITESACLHAGYQFRGSTASPSAASEIPDVPDFRAHSMRWHELRVGLTVHF